MKLIYLYLGFIEADFKKSKKKQRKLTKIADFCSYFYS